MVIKENQEKESTAGQIVVSISKKAENLKDKEDIKVENLEEIKVGRVRGKAENANSKII